MLSFNQLMQTMRGFQESRILLTAVELDIFTAVGNGSTAGEIAARIGADARATESLLNALVAIGALEKKDGVFHNTSETAGFLVAGTPDYAQPALMHVVNMWNSWSTLSECVRAGTAVMPPSIEEKRQPWMRSFIAAMHRNAETVAGQLVRTVGAAGVRRLLDIGGGSGAYSIAFAQANKELRAEVFDLEIVMPIAQSHIREAGLEDRVTTRIGDLRRDEFGNGYDLILLSAICHMLGPDENNDLFGRCRRALATGGRLVIRDFILDPDKTGPKQAAIFALNMLVGTRTGSTYTRQEYADWLAVAGFPSVSRPDADIIVASL